LFEKSLLVVVATGLVGWLLYLNFDDGIVHPKFEGEGEFILVQTENSGSPGAITAQADQQSGYATISAAEAFAPKKITLDSVIVRTQYAGGEVAPHVSFQLARFARSGYAESSRTHTTGEKGEVRVSGLTPGQYGIYGDRGGHASFQLLHMELSESAEIEQLIGQLTPVSTMKIPAGHDVTGTVIDMFGQGVAGADVWVTMPTTRRRNVVVAHTDADGAFTVKQLSADCFFGARAAGYHPSKPLSIEHLLKEGSDMNVTLALPGAGTAVKGWVLDPDGDPVAGARVRVGEQDGQLTRGPSGVEGPAPPIEVLTADDGSFTAGGIVPGEVQLAVSAEGWPIWVGTFLGQEGASARVEIQLEHGAWVSGHLTDETGAPIDNIHVNTSALRALGTWGNASSFRGIATTTDGLGYFRLGPLTPGDVEVHARVRGGSQAASGKFTAISGQEYEWNLQLKGMPFITGTARAADGTTLAGWTISANPEMSGGPAPIATRTGKDGTFRMDLTSNGTVRIEMHRPDSPPSSAPCTWVNDIATGTQNLDVYFDPEQEPEGVLRGELRSASGGVNPRSTLTVWHDTFGRIAEVLAPEGQAAFELSSLPAGKMTLTVKSDGYAKQHVKDIELAHRAERDLGVIELQLEDS